MAASGDVEITIVDGGAGAVVVAAASLQLVIGPADDGPEAQVVATRNPATLAAIFKRGPLMQAAAMAIASGGTVLAMRAATVTDGEASAVTMARVGASTSVISVSGTPVDEFYVVVNVTTGGTQGTAGIRFRLSLDAGRTFGPELALGTAATYVIPDTGLTLDFGAGTLEKGDKARFGTTPPITDVAGVEACLDAIEDTQYAIAGWASSHVVTPFSGSDAATIQGKLDELQEDFTFTRTILEARDVSPAAVWGGTDETEQEWVTDILTDFSALDAPRLCQVAGNYNMASVYPTAVCGVPKYRRSLAWALAARQVRTAAQTLASRVSDGAVKQINVDPTNDPGDGFVYHDERSNPALQDGRFSCARTRKGLPGVYLTPPLLMSPAGSTFKLLPHGNVIDVACSIVHQVGQREIDSDILLNDNGTIAETEAQAIERTVGKAIKTRMKDVKMISNYKVTVDRDKDVRSTDEVDFDVKVFSRGYVLSEKVTIGFASADAGG